MKVIQETMFEALRAAETALKNSMPKNPTPVGKNAHARSLHTVSIALEQYRKHQQKEGQQQ